MLIDERFMDLFRRDGLAREPTLRDLVRWADAKGLTLMLDVAINPGSDEKAENPPAEGDEGLGAVEEPQGPSEASEDDFEGDVAVSKYDKNGFDYTG
jgi:hypothetical protein